MNINKNYLIIDGSNILYRAYYGFPRLINREKKLINVIYGFLIILNKLSNIYNNSKIIIVFDYYKKTFRHYFYEKYKKNRKKTPIEIKNQIPELIKILKCLPINLIIRPGFEADDIISTLINIIKNKTKDSITYIFTSDKDMQQLLDKDVYIISPNDYSIINKENFIRKNGFPPENLIYYLAIKGDKTDNINGIKRINNKILIDFLANCKNIITLIEKIRNSETIIKNNILTNINLIKRNILLIKLKDNIKFSENKISEILNKKSSKSNLFKQKLNKLFINYKRFENLY